MGIAAADVNLSRIGFYGGNFADIGVIGHFESILRFVRRAQIPIAAVCFACMAVTACTRDTAVRGNLPRPEKLDQVKVGLTTRNDVRELLGPPSNIGTFNDNAWYYISQTTEDVPMNVPQVLDRTIIAIHFNSQGIVDDIRHLDKTAGRDIDPVDRTTPAAGNEPSLLHDLFGNIGKVGAGTSSGSPSP